MRRLYLYFVFPIVRKDSDRIVPLIGGTGKESLLIDRVRNQLENLLGPEAGYHFEQETEANFKSTFG